MGSLYVTQTGELVRDVRRVKTTEPTGPRPPLPGLMKFVVNLLGPSGTTVKSANILHILASNPSDVTVSNMTTAVNYLSSQWLLDFSTVISNIWRESSYELIALDGSGLNVVTGPGSGFTGSASVLSPNCSVVLSWQSNAYWRGGKFRTYMSGVLASYLAAAGSNMITSAAQSAYQGAASAFRTGVNTHAFGSGLMTLGGVSYYHNYAFRTPPIFLGFSGVKVHPRLDSQRRRLGIEVP